MDAGFSNTVLLGDVLREARVAKGLELNDIAEITHVRKEHLQALEEGRYGDLPEDIYARNFLRLYAQAVGLDDTKLLERFARERRAFSALGISTVPETVGNGVQDVTPKHRNPAAMWLPEETVTTYSSSENDQILPKDTHEASPKIAEGKRRLTTLGRLELEGSDLKRPKPLLLLAYLSLEGPQERRHLAELFWPQSTNGLASLSTALYRISKDAKDSVDTDELRVWSRVETDAQVLLSQLGTPSWNRSLYRGAFLQGLSLPDWSSEIEEWVYETRERIAKRVQKASLELAEKTASLGQFKEAAAQAEEACKLPGATELEPEDLSRYYSLLIAGENPYAHIVKQLAQQYEIEVNQTVQIARGGFVTNNKTLPDALQEQFGLNKQVFHPQRPFNDLASGNDLLDVATEAYALSETLMLRGLEPPLSLGILGNWGSGKSFIMYLMQKRMTQIRCQLIEEAQEFENSKNHSTFVGHIYQIRFDAWMYAKSSLWASLMQTIFFELNRQLTLENKLAEKLAKIRNSDKGSVLRQGGHIWQALHELSEERLRVLLQQEDTNLWQQIQQAKSADESEDILWETLQSLREDELKKLRSVEAELAKQKEALHKAEEELRKEVEQEIQKEARQAAFIPVHLKLVELLGDQYGDFKERLEAEYVNINVNEQPENQGANVEAKSKSVESLRISRGNILKILRQNPVQFCLLALISAGSVFVPNLGLKLLGLMDVPEWLLFLIAPIFLGFASGLAKWQKTLRESVDIYYEQVDAERKRIEGEKEERVQRKLAEQKATLNKKLEKVSKKPGDDKENEALQELSASSSPNIPAIQKLIEKLEEQTQKQRQVIGLTAHYVSLLEFVNSRLDESFYEKELGLMHQVQRDLIEMTEALLSQKELFPRGKPRVVLYIDDLDRCPPHRVVEVLEATQLLLKTKLFVVVMAVDIRYVTRALEKVYEGILFRDGHPSGLDYIEKIIQIPYQVRPIHETSLNQYLQFQMQMQQADSTTLLNPPNTIYRPNNQQDSDIFLYDSKDESRIHAEKGDDSDISVAEEGILSRRTVAQIPTLIQSDAIFEKMIPAQEIEFTSSEFDTILICCRNLGLTPRNIKRLVNITKLLKIIWFRRNKNLSPEVVKAIISLTALSNSHSEVMSVLLQDFISLENQSIPLVQVVSTSEICLRQPKHDQRIIKAIFENTALVATGLTSENIGIENLLLIRSFYFK